MHIKVLGTGCAKCNKLEQKVREIVDEMGIEAVVTKVSDMEGISRYGIVMTPGIVINEILLSVGSVPTDSQIIKWIKEYSK